MLLAVSKPLNTHMNLEPTVSYLFEKCHMPKNSKVNAQRRRIGLTARQCQLSDCDHRRRLGYEITRIDVVVRLRRKADNHPV